MKTWNKIFIAISLFFTSANIAFCQAFDVTLESLLEEMASFDEATLYPDYSCRQQSSYDRRSTMPDNMYWFANDDGGGFIRTEKNGGRTEKVLFEDLNPGVITRIWLTTFDRTGTIRFYFDGHTSADWSIPAYDFLQFGIPLGLGLCQPHINNIEGGKGGSTFFLPIPYSQSCKVTLEEPSDDFSTPRYFHFNYRNYPTSTKIETFSQEVANRASQKIASTNSALLNPETFKGGTLLSKSENIAANNSLAIDLPNGMKAVKTLEISISGFDSDQYEQLMRDLVLTAQFDGKETVWAPLSDFSGGGMGSPSVKSWFLDADGNGKIVSRWTMPYQTTGRIEIKNYSTQNVDISLSANVDTYSWRENSLYFHTSWKQQMDIPVTNLWENVIDWNFSTITGKGVYKGDVLTLYNHTPSWYGEGDEKIYVDNETFPSHFGTGTEDYYNCSWAPVSPFQTPFGGAPRADYESSTGYNTFFRTRNLDAIPFSSKLKFDIEMLSWSTGTSDYATTAYWYGEANALAEGTSGVDEATRELLPKPEDPFDYAIPNSIEFETLAPTYKSASILTETQVMTGFTGFKWSKGKQLLCRNSQEGNYLEYKLSGYDQKKYRIQIQGTKAGDFGILSFSINGNTPTSIDFYNDGVIHTGAISIGEFTPINGEFTLRVTYTGKNSKSNGNLFGLDCLQIIESDFKVENAIEFENYLPSAISGFSGDFPQEMSFYINGKWSDKNHKVYVGGAKGSSIDYLFNNLDGAAYDMTLYATKGPDFGILSFDINNNALSLKFDGYHSLVSDSGPIYLGEFEPRHDGSINLRINVAGTNPFSEGPRYIVGLDCILLEKKGTVGIDSDITGRSTFYRLENKKLFLDNSLKVSFAAIYNIEGKQLFKSQTAHSFDLSSCSEGNYIVQLISESKKFSDIFYLPKY